MSSNFSVLIILIFLIKFTISDSPPYCSDGYPIIIVGSGLAGHSAAAEAVSILKSQNKFKSHPIVVFEKEAKFGGNSGKATSGINGANTEFQQNAHIMDNIPDFTRDTYYSSIGGKQNDNKYNNNNVNNLIRTLISSSASAVNWLKNKFKLELTSISQCGGHSHPRTHRLQAGPVGNIIVKTIHKTIETDVEWRYNCRVIELLMDTDSKTVIGIKYIDKNDNNKIKEYYGLGVILTSGGFGNDHTPNSLLDKYSTLNEYKLPTTNGGWATGDGVKFGKKIGAKLIDMKEIQIHPTGFINNKAPNDMTKFLAPEALRGLGGILINNKGERFVNELDLRKIVVNEMRKQENNLNNLPFRLLLNDNVKEAFGTNINFYIKFGLISEYNNIEELSADIGIDNDILVNTINKYVSSSSAGIDEFGKTIFPNGNTYNINDKIYVASITPVIHYTMGGLAINSNAQILDINDDVINGFYGAGEVTGGVHGKNRLAGNSLLECVVFGRIAAKNIINYCENVNKNKKLHHNEL